MEAGVVTDAFARSPHSKLDIALYPCYIFSSSAQTGVDVYAVLSRGCHAAGKCPRREARLQVSSGNIPENKGLNPVHL